MSWIQEPEVDALEPMGSVCSCIGATCKGRCTPYAVCLMYLGNKCKHFINNDVQEAEAVSIAWYGGEPLLCPEIIQRITENIHVKDGGFTASVITNGYFLDRKMAEFLQRQKVGYAQVTVDGPPDIHNARRRLPNGQDTFHRICFT